MEKQSTKESALNRAPNYVVLSELQLFDTGWRPLLSPRRRTMDMLPNPESVTDIRVARGCIEILDTICDAGSSYLSALTGAGLPTMIGVLALAATLSGTEHWLMASARLILVVLTAAAGTVLGSIHPQREWARALHLRQEFRRRAHQLQR